MKKTRLVLKRVIVAVLVMAVLCGAFPGIESVSLAPMEVRAAEDDPFDTTKLTEVSSGVYSGFAYTMYDNGLLWLEDDTSGKTQYEESPYFKGERFLLEHVVRYTECTEDKDNIKYAYVNVTAPTDASAMFMWCDKLVKVSFGDVFVNSSSNMTSMANMFYGCRALETLDFGGFDTSKVTTMEQMFYQCSKLKKIDLSSFNTGNVTNMSNMFAFCIELGEVELSSFDTSNVTDMSDMFHNCIALAKPDIGGFNTSKVTDMSGMFSGCTAINELDLSNFKAYPIKMAGMFKGCENLTKVNMPNFDMADVIDMSYLFAQCYKLEEIDVSGWDTNSVRNMSRMFYGCNAVTQLDVSNWDTSDVTDMSFMFCACATITELDVSNWDTSGVTDMSYMFHGIKNVPYINLRNFNTSQVTNMSAMFDESGFKKLDLSCFDTSKVTDMSSMFYKCQALEELDVSTWNTSNVTKMYWMFDGGIGVKVLDLSSFDMSSVKDASNLLSDSWYPRTLHILKTPRNCTFNDIELGEPYYKINDDKTIDRTVKYTNLPSDSDTSITLVMELLHECDTVTDNIGTCVTCGVTVKYGDVNDDGEISIADAVALKKYLAGNEDGNINLGAADVDVSKHIMVTDAVKLAKYLAGMDVKLGMCE